MVYGPIAAFLVESFPARIRYTSLSLPYHFGNGWFGGFTPVIATSIVAATGNKYAGLWFPIGVSLMTFVVGSFLPPRNEESGDLARGRGPGGYTIARLGAATVLLPTTRLPAGPATPRSTRVKLRNARNATTANTRSIAPANNMRPMVHPAPTW
jgi:hypothetical protein